MTEFDEGDRIRIRKETDSGVAVYEGIFMPTASRNIVIKLDSGYNVGIQPENVEIEVVSKAGALKEPSMREGAKEGKKEERLPSLAILSTGGTIASKVDYRTGAVSPQFSTEDLLDAIPELGSIANIKGKVVYSILSENMRAEYWQKLAAEVHNEIKNGADGVIVTHGTDTMGYTAAALAFMVQTPVPIVLVGSQRSSDRPSSDATMNAICAAKVACSDLAEVVVVMHGSTSDDFCAIHRGTKVRKMHTSARDAFQSINDIPIGTVQYVANDIESTRVDFAAAHSTRGERKLELRDKLETKCTLIKSYPGADPAIIEFFVEQGYKGLVLEGTGLGHVSAEWIPAVTNTVKRGIPVVMTSQCLYGAICDRVYDTGRDLLHAGIIEGEDMLPETALVKLMWVLGQTRDMGEVRRMMHENIAGEIKGRRTL
ncbi:MAG: Glu-tRNA(Gln) amidotransferase subunit GatD [Methanomicrobia archaeon]|nr:Glu-tRNA(Gln) amidotransferase subunit GatD [Methanomicrobia archaeon]